MNKKKECSISKECSLIKFFDNLGDTSNSNSSLFTKKEEKKEEKIHINVSLLDKLHKLRLFSQNDEQSVYGWSSETFIEWLENEKLTETDFNYLLGSNAGQYPKIVKAAIKRQKELFSKSKPKKRKESAYLDKNGNITWYIKNISPNHIVICDLERGGDHCRINRGKKQNLLEDFTLAQIKKSKNLIKQIDIGNIKRLTEKEYIIELEKFLSRRSIIPGLK